MLIEDVQRAVAKHYDLPLSAMRDPGHDRKRAHPRQVAMYLAREMFPYSWERIARPFKRDRTTVLHGVRAVEQRLQSDDLLRARVNLLRRDITMDARLKP